MNIKKNMFMILITMLSILLIISTISLSYEPKDFNNEISTTGTGTTNVKKAGGKVVGLIRVVGTIVAVGILMILGIKYMTGSAEERAEYKKTLFPYAIGAVLIFAATSLADMIYNWAIALE